MRFAAAITFATGYTVPVHFLCSKRRINTRIESIENTRLLQFRARYEMHFQMVRRKA